MKKFIVLCLLLAGCDNEFNNIQTQQNADSIVNNGSDEAESKVFESSGLNIGAFVSSDGDNYIFSFGQLTYKTDLKKIIIKDYTVIHLDLMCSGKFEMVIEPDTSTNVLGVKDGEVIYSSNPSMTSYSASFILDDGVCVPYQIQNGTEKYTVTLSKIYTADIPDFLDSNLRFIESPITID